MSWNWPRSLAGVKCWDRLIEVKFRGLYHALLELDPKVRFTGVRSRSLAALQLCHLSPDAFSEVVKNQRIIHRDCTSRFFLYNVTNLGIKIYINSNILCLHIISSRYLLMFKDMEACPVTSNSSLSLDQQIVLEQVQELPCNRDFASF